MSKRTLQGTPCTASKARLCASCQDSWPWSSRHCTDHMREKLSDRLKALSRVRPPSSRTCTQGSTQSTCAWLPGRTSTRRRGRTFGGGRRRRT